MLANICALSTPDDNKANEGLCNYKLKLMKMGGDAYCTRNDEKLLAAVRERKPDKFADFGEPQNPPPLGCCAPAI